jgi:hypothetical protein
VWQTKRVGFRHTALSRLRPLAGPLSFTGHTALRVVGEPEGGNFAGADLAARSASTRASRTERIGLVAAETGRQQPPQQFGSSPAPGDGTGFVILIVDLSPTRRRLPGFEMERGALATVRSELGDLAPWPWVLLQHGVDLFFGGQIRAKSVTF